MTTSKQNNSSASSVLSQHLFWDVVKENIDFEKNKKWIINRVLEYGLIDDWVYIFKYYGSDEIAKTAINLRDIDKRTACLVSVLSGVPKEHFLCYNTEQSSPKHWNF